MALEAMVSPARSMAKPTATVGAMAQRWYVAMDACFPQQRLGDLERSRWIGLGGERSDWVGAAEEAGARGGWERLRRQKISPQLTGSRFPSAANAADLASIPA